MQRRRSEPAIDWYRWSAQVLLAYCYPRPRERKSASSTYLLSRNSFRCLGTHRQLTSTRRSVASFNKGEPTMAGSVNKVIIVGNLGADPEVRDLPSGQKVANLRLATSEQWTDRASGEKRERTEWHTVNVFDQNAAQYAQSYLRKGNKVYVEGRVETRKWQDQSGTERYSTEIVVNQIGGKLIGRSGGQEARGDQNYEYTQTRQSSEIDDIIPF